MADQDDMLAEAYRRGLLPPERKALYEEAIKRGLVARINPEIRNANARPGGFPYDEPGRAYGTVLPFSYTPDPKTGNAVPGTVQLAVPEFIRAPLRGVLEGGARLRGERPEEYGRGATPDELAAVSFAASPLRFGEGTPAFAPGTGNNMLARLQGIADRAPPPARNVLAERAGDIVLRRFQQDQAAGGPAGPEIRNALADARATGKPLTLADLGGTNVQGLAGAVSRAPGPAKQFVESTTRERLSGAGDRLMADVDRSIAAGSGYDAAKDLYRARSAEAGPLWDTAMSQPVSIDQARQVQRFITDPDGQEGFAAGLRSLERRALADGKLFDPEKHGAVRSKDTGRWIIDPDVVAGRKTPSMPLLQTVKEAFDAAVEDMRASRPFNSRPSRAEVDIDRVRRAYVGKLRDMFPAYGRALDAWAGPSQNIEAMEQGQDFLRMRPEEITDRLGGMSEGQRQFFRLGAADSLRKAILKKSVTAPEIRGIARSSHDSMIKQQLRPLFDTQEQFDRFLDAVTTERGMAETAQRLLRGSQTAERQEESQDLETAANAARAVAHGATGNWLAAAHAAWRLRRDLGLRNKPELNMEIAKLLFSPMSDLSSPTARRAMGETGPRSLNALALIARSLPFDQQQR